MNKSVVLCSGGLNSAVLLALAKEAGPIHLLHLRYDRPASRREADLAAKLAAHFKINDALVVDLPHITTLRNQLVAAADAAAPTRIPADAPVPGLLTTIVAAGATAAAAAGATRLWFGLGELPSRAGDDAPPDAAQSREFIQLMECALALTAPTPITLEAPLVDMTRGDIVMLARRMEIPLKLTWSCWTSGENPCQSCPGCRSRACGFLDATTPDPIIARPASPTPATQPAAV